MRQLWRVPLFSLVFTSFLVVTDKCVIAADLFESILTGNQEVAGAPPGPFTPSPSGSSGMGFATGELTGSPGNWVFNYEINYSDLSGSIAAPFAHIHDAPKGENGAIVHDLDNADVPPIAGSKAGTITGDWSFDDEEDPLTNALAQNLLDNGLYFNIHTSDFPSGEIRGQIMTVPEPGTMMGFALAGGVGLLSRWRKSTK